MAHEDYCSFEQAVKLVKLGFKEEVFFHFNSETKEIEPIEGASYSEGGPFDTYDVLEDVTKYGLIPTPSLSQAQKWLREVKKIYIEIRHYRDKRVTKFEMAVGRPSSKGWGFNSWVSQFRFDTYEQALSAGIDKALELLKEESK